MLHLMKYETRKSLFSKIILLIVVGIFELLFLYGLYFTDSSESSVMALGISGLVISCMVGIGFIGIESLFTLYQDLNSKQSYMLFMTPHTSYTILGAKIVENALAILVSGCIFAVLAGIDLTMVFAKYGSISELITFISNIFSVEIELDSYALTAVMVFFEMLFSWILMIVIGYLAITLSSSVLSGRKFNALVSFALFLLLEFLSSKLIFSVSDHAPAAWSDTAIFAAVLFLEILLSAVVYFVTSYIMERKLSV